MRAPWSRVVAAYFAVAAVLTAVVSLVGRWRPAAGASHAPSWIDGWFHYDSGWYLAIAKQGYWYDPGQQSSIAFFPVYPMSMRGLGNVLSGNYRLAGWLITVLAGLAVALLFARWVWDRLPRRSAVLAVVVLLVYPYAFFLYGAIYADALFVLCCIGAFLLLERRWYLAAGLVGALATAGRPVGIAVAVGLVVRALELLASDRAAVPGRVPLREVVGSVRDVRLRHAGVLVSALGLGLWCWFLWRRFGDPLAFVHVESAPGWDQGVGPHTWFKLSYVEMFTTGHWHTGLLLTLQAIACVVAVLLLPRVWRLFGWGYLAFSVVVLAIPIVGTDDFMGTGRYVLAAFPVMAAAGDFVACLRRPGVRWALVGASAVLLLALTALYGASYEVS